MDLCFRQGWKFASQALGWPRSVRLHLYICCWIHLKSNCCVLKPQNKMSGSKFHPNQWVEKNEWNIFNHLYIIYKFANGPFWKMSVYCKIHVFHIFVVSSVSAILAIAIWEGDDNGGQSRWVCLQYHTVLLQQTSHHTDESGRWGKVCLEFINYIFSRFLFLRGVGV